MKKIRSRKKPKWKKRSSVGIKEPLPEWKKIYYRAMKKEYDESYRSLVAKNASMMDALSTFTNNMMIHLNKCSGNLGLLLEHESAVSGSLVIRGTGDNGANEFIPVKLTVKLGPIQEYGEHIESLKSEWIRKGSEIEEANSNEEVLKDYSDQPTLQ